MYASKQTPVEKTAGLVEFGSKSAVNSNGTQGFAQVKGGAEESVASRASAVFRCWSSDKLIPAGR